MAAAFRPFQDYARISLGGCFNLSELPLDMERTESRALATLNPRSNAMQSSELHQVDNNMCLPMALQEIPD